MSDKPKRSCLVCTPELLKELKRADSIILRLGRMVRKTYYLECIPRMRKKQRAEAIAKAGGNE